MKQVLVSGDCVCDHNVYKGDRRTADSAEERGVVEKQECGGALLLHKLISQTLKISGKDDWQAEFGFGPHLDDLPSEYHAFCLWEPQVKDPSAEKKDRFDVWRAIEPPLGYGHPGSASPPTSCDKSCGIPSAAPKRRAGYPEIVVLDDSGLGFRDQAFAKQWSLPSKPKTKSAPQWVVLKLSGSVGDGDLWKRIETVGSDNLVIVVSADQLRCSDVRIGRGLSWETTTGDLISELKINPALKPLCKARHLIVTFGLDAVFWMNNPHLGDERKPGKCKLVFDARNAEGDWMARQGEGTVFGYQICFVTAIAHQLCVSIEKDVPPDFEAAITAGLGASRELRRIGHGRVSIAEVSDGKRKENFPVPGFPLDDIAEAITKGSEYFASAPVPDSILNREEWMFLDEWQIYATEENRQGGYYEAALAVATRGATALASFPAAKLGGLQTVDRKEIESLRTIRKLILDYECGGLRKQPLNIGVFGPPGAGKSFGVKQIAKAVLGKDVEILTFNLSQFNTPDDIVGALHQVRDAVLSQRTPVVFWDEFDSKEYKWLQYLLAPMQDGSFQDGQVTHPIGKSIFIFAGATGWNYAAFGPIDPNDIEKDKLKKLNKDRRKELEKNWCRFTLSKGPDFKSRLVGYLDVLGPNVRKKCCAEDGCRLWSEDAEDLYFPIRRALFIRGQFGLEEGKLLDLDTGVLQAMLEVPEYKSGSRSLEFLCQHLQHDAAGRVPTRSNLPGRRLLDMHVDADGFWEICEREMEYAPLGPALADALHEAYRLRIKGNPGKASLDRPLHEISGSNMEEDYLAVNVAQALRIPGNLALVGLKLVCGKKVAFSALSKSQTKAEEPLQLLLTRKDNLEMMAEAEHNGWMVDKIRRGWTCGKRDDNTRKHDCLIPYSQLTEEIKSYDRLSITGQPAPAGKPEEEQFGYIDIVKVAGFRVVKKK